MLWLVNFFDKHGTETRTLTVAAETEDDAESKAAEEADAAGWSRSFKVADAQPIETT